MDMRIPWNLIAVYSRSDWIRSKRIRTSKQSKLRKRSKPHTHLKITFRHYPKNLQNSKRQKELHQNNAQLQHNPKTPTPLPPILREIHPTQRKTNQLKHRQFLNHHDLQVLPRQLSLSSKRRSTRTKFRWRQVVLVSARKLSQWKLAVQFPKPAIWVVDQLHETEWRFQWEYSFKSKC